VERVWLEVDGGDLLVGDVELVWVGVLVQAGVDLEAGVGGRCGDEVDDGFVGDEGLPAPVLADVTEQAVLGLG